MHYIVIALVSLALLLIGVVGHRHWLPTTTPTPTVIEEPVVVEQPKPKKPVKKPVKKPTPKKTEPKKTEPKKPAPKPVPTPPRRECDEYGWCWTHF